MTDEIKGLVERLEQCLDGWCSIISGSDGTTGFAPPRAGPGSYQWIEQVTEEAATLLAQEREARVRAEGQLRHAREASVILSGDPEAVETYQALRAERDAFAGQVEFIRLCRDSTTESLLAAEARAEASEALVRELVEVGRNMAFQADRLLAALRDGGVASDGQRAHASMVLAREVTAIRSLIAVVENHGSSRAETAASDAVRPDCSAAQSLDGGEG